MSAIITSIKEPRVEHARSLQAVAGRQATGQYLITFEMDISNATT